MNTKLHLIRREPCEPRVILHKRRHALDLNKFTAAGVQVITRDSASQTCSVPDSPVILAQPSFGVGSGRRRQGPVHCFFIQPLLLTLAVGPIQTHTEHRQTHVHTDGMCAQQAKCTHSHTANALSFSSVVTTPSPSKLQSDKPLLGTSRRSPQINDVFQCAHILTPFLSDRKHLRASLLGKTEIQGEESLPSLECSRDPHISLDKGSRLCLPVEVCRFCLGR